MAGGRRLFDHKLARFVVVGGGAAALLSGLTYLFLRLGFAPFWGGLIAYAIAFVTAYVLQRNWTFQRPGGHRRTLPRYLATQLVCAALSGGLTHLFRDALGYGPAVTAVLSTAAVSALSFVLSSQWVFRDQADPR